MASALITTPSISAATLIATADLPLAVGPAIRTAILLKAASMPLLLSLIADPQKAPLTQDHVETARAAAVALGASAGEGRWLSPREAWSCSVEGIAPGAVSALRMRLAGQPVDLNLVDDTGTRPVLVADMDSTMIEQECIDELADVAGAGDKVRAITARAMNGELAFEDALRERVPTLQGLPAQVIHR
jgi:phosphoserine phosphatase